MKKVIKRMFPICLAAIILCQTVYSSVEVARASGVEQMLYYTYWDLITSIYSVCGYESKTDVSVANNHGVTGKQAWDNFVTFVENSAKANYKFVGDGMSKAFSELENIVNTATEKGISMTQDLYDMLKSVFADQVENVSNGNQFDCSSVKKVDDMIYSITGGYLDNFRLHSIVDEGYLLNIIYSNGRYSVFTWNPDDGVLDSEFHDWSKQYDLIYYKDGNAGLVSSIAGSSIRNGETSYDMSLATGYASLRWIIKNGAFAGTDTISAQVSAVACPKEVPDVVPWRKDVAIPDEWRVIEGGNDSDSDDDKKKRRHVLPIPIILPNITIDPDEGKDSEKDTDPDQDPDRDPDRDPDPDPDPDPDHEKDVDTIIDDVKGIGDITKLFPFCIPFDMVELIRGMSAERKPPHFVFKYRFDKINYTFKVDVDLSDYDKYIKLFRYGMQVLYVLALMFLTARISNYFS